MNGVPSSPPLRVLVVDDCRDTTASLALLLKLWKHDVRVAHDGPGALEEARGYTPHVVLLDLALRPGMDGYEVARRLRALPDFDDTLLICMTGYGREADRRQSGEAGFDHLLLKPADPQQLQQLLAAWKAVVADQRVAVAR